MKNFIPYKKTVSAIVAASFSFSLVLPPAYAQQTFMPAPGQMVWLSTAFEPVTLKGMAIHPENPLLFDFIVDRGEDWATGEKLKDESEKLVKYFLTALTIADKESWVNLSPYEADRIIPETLGRTEMGKQMLEQDYLLKQLSASLTNPEKELGQKFWDEVKKQSNGSDVNVSTFNKVWIVPNGATVAEKDGKVYITASRLKVMLEEDYEAMIKEGNGNMPVNSLSSKVFRSIILPQLEKEINEGQNFAPTRQIYQSVILASWYKRALRESLLGKIYMDRGKVDGVDISDRSFKEKVYKQYLEAFRKGVYSIIKEEEDGSGDILPRKYFSGGLGLGTSDVKITTIAGSAAVTAINKAARVLNGRASSATFQLAEPGTQEPQVVAKAASSIADDNEHFQDGRRRFSTAPDGTWFPGGIAKVMAGFASEDFESKSNTVSRAWGYPPGINPVTAGMMPETAQLQNVFVGVMNYLYGISIEFGDNGVVRQYSINDREKFESVLEALRQARSGSVNKKFMYDIELTITAAMKVGIYEHVARAGASKGMTRVNLDVPAVNGPINQMVYEFKKAITPMPTSSSSSISEQKASSPMRVKETEETRKFKAFQEKAKQIKDTVDLLFETLKVARPALRIAEDQEILRELLHMTVEEMLAQINGRMTLEDAMDKAVDDDTQKAFVVFLHQQKPTLTQKDMIVLFEILGFSNKLPSGQAGEFIKPGDNEKKILSLVLDQLSSSSAIAEEDLDPEERGLYEALRVAGVGEEAALDIIARELVNEELALAAQAAGVPPDQIQGILSAMTSTEDLLEKQKIRQQSLVKVFIDEAKLARGRFFANAGARDFFGDSSKTRQGRITFNGRIPENDIGGEQRALKDKIDETLHGVLYHLIITTFFIAKTKSGDDAIAEGIARGVDSFDIYDYLQRSARIERPDAKSVIRNRGELEEILLAIGFKEDRQVLGKFLPYQDEIKKQLTDSLKTLLSASSNVAVQAELGNKFFPFQDVQSDKASSTVGGINFDPTLLNLQIKRDGNGIPLPLPQQNIPQIDIRGFYPIMINIQPLNNIPAFLGMESLPEPAQKLVSS